MKLIVEEHHALPIVDVEAVVCCGAAHDPVGKEGLARHALELCRRGAGGRSRADIDAAFDSLGAEIHPTYRPDATTHSIRCLARNVQPVLALLGDVLFRPELAEDEHERLVREGLATLDDMRDDDATLASRYFDRFALDGHPYGRTGLGTADSIARLTRDDAADWIARHVHAGNLLLGFAGDLPAGGEELAAPIAALTPSAAPPPEAIPPVALAAGRRTYLIDKPERAQAHIVVGHAAPPPAHPDALPLLVATTVFGGTFSSRLVSEVRVRRGWSYTVGSRVFRARAGHTFRVRVVPSAERAADTLALVLDLLATFAANGATDEEIEFAKSYLHGGYAFDVASAADRLERRVEAHLWDLPPDNHLTFRSRLANVTPADVNRAIARWIRPEASVVAAVASADAIELPGAEIVPFDSY